MFLIDSFHRVGGIFEIGYVFDLYQVLLFNAVESMTFLVRRTLNITI